MKTQPLSSVQEDDEPDLTYHKRIDTINISRFIDGSRRSSTSVDTPSGSRCVTQSTLKQSHEKRINGSLHLKTADTRTPPPSPLLLPPSPKPRHLIAPQTRYPRLLQCLQHLHDPRLRVPRGASIIRSLVLHHSSGFVDSRRIQSSHQNVREQKTRSVRSGVVRDRSHPVATALAFVVDLVDA